MRSSAAGGERAGVGAWRTDRGKPRQYKRRRADHCASAIRPHVAEIGLRGDRVETVLVEDVLHRFLLERAGVRGALVRLGPAWREVAGRADYPPELRELLGQALVSSALLTANIKLDGELSVQLKSAGALRLLFAECTDQGRLRGLVRWEPPL